MVNLDQHDRSDYEEAIIQEEEGECRDESNIIRDHYQPNHKCKKIANRRKHISNSTRYDTRPKSADFRNNKINESLEDENAIVQNKSREKNPQHKHPRSRINSETSSQKLNNDGRNVADSMTKNHTFSSQHGSLMRSSDLNNDTLYQNNKIFETKNNKHQQMMESSFDLDKNLVELKSNFNSPVDIRIVDPYNGGEEVVLNQNRSLTNKELQIMTRTNNEEDHCDDSSTLSLLTDVSYYNKGDRLRREIDQIKEAAMKIIDGNSCGSSKMHLPSFFDIKNPIYSQDPQDNLCLDSTRTNHFCNKNEKLCGPKEKNEKNDKLIDSVKVNTAFYFQAAIAQYHGNGMSMNFGSFDEKVFVCILRKYSASAAEIRKDVVKNRAVERQAFRFAITNKSIMKELGNEIKGIRCSWNEPNVSYELGVTFFEGQDGKAYVNSVFDGSIAQKSGVIIGDAMSFAVPLNYKPQEHESTCTLVSSLENIGMRTSYRELFDMFLSKTNSGQTVAVAFRRKSEAMVMFDKVPSTIPSNNILLDCYKATDFVHELITKSKEYDFECESNGNYEIIRGNIEHFMPQPRSRLLSETNKKPSSLLRVMKMRLENSFNQFSLNWECNYQIPFIPSRSQSTLSAKSTEIKSDPRRVPLLSSLIEDTRGLFFLSLSRSMVGQGLAIARLSDSSWSAPAAVVGNISTSSRFEKGLCSMECIILVKCKEQMKKFQQEQRLRFVKKKDVNNDVVGSSPEDDLLTDFVCLGKKGGRFFWLTDFSCTLYENKSVNSSLQKGNLKLSTSYILKGKSTPPKESKVFYQTLTRMEYPSTMYPHPSLPKTMENYFFNDWKLSSSCIPSNNISLKAMSLRGLFNNFSSCDSHLMLEEKREFEMFIVKFKLFLFDGVPVDHILLGIDRTKMNAMKDIIPERTGVLKLHLLPGQLLKDAELHFIDRRPSSSKRLLLKQKSKKIPSPTNITKLNIISIVQIKQSAPSNLQNLILSKATKKKNNKVLSIENKEMKNFLFKAKSSKDALLISCGLKILLEQLVQQEIKND